MSFELHKQAIQDADDIALTKAVAACVAECRRRALFNKSYIPLSTAIIKNLEKNAAQRAAGFDGQD